MCSIYCPDLQMKTPTHLPDDDAQHDRASTSAQAGQISPIFAQRKLHVDMHFEAQPAIHSCSQTTPRQLLQNVHRISTFSWSVPAMPRSTRAWLDGATTVISSHITADATRDAAAADRPEDVGVGSKAILTLVFSTSNWIKIGEVLR